MIEDYSALTPITNQPGPSTVYVERNNSNNNPEDLETPKPSCSLNINFNPIKYLCSWFSDKENILPSGTSVYKNTVIPNR